MERPCVELGFRSRVYVGPQGKIHPDVWGYYQFPNMFRGSDGRLFLSVHVGPDSALGHHEPSPWFASRDEGRSWETVSAEQVDRTPLPIELPDGQQVRIGAGQPEKIFPRRLGVEHAFGPFFEDYGFRDMVAYRLGDLPAESLRFPIAVRQSGTQPWLEDQGVLELPELFILAAIRGQTWFDPKDRKKWEDIEPVFRKPVPRKVTVLPDGTMLAPLAGQHPRITNRKFAQAICIASNDAGRTWRVRGVIADDPKLSTHGYGGAEMELARMFDGSLLCVMRTLMSAHREDSQYLAASRSVDGGFTWSSPESIAAFSVTPHLLPLACGTACVVYGRPGVYIRTSDDAGKNWSEPLALVGPTEESLLRRPIESWYPSELLIYSCANTTVVVTGKDRFLLAYSDFRQPHPDGGLCKAILVQEVIVG